MVKKHDHKDVDEFYDCDNYEEYGETTSIPEQQEFIVLLEENGQPIVSPTGKNRGRRLSALSKRAVLAAKAAAKKAMERRTYTRKFFLKVLLVVVVGLALVQVSIMMVQTESNDDHNTINDPNDELSKEDSVSDSTEQLAGAFQIAQNRFQSRLTQLMQSKHNNQNATITTITGYNNLQESPFRPSHPLHPNRVLNSIRIPKAGSSSLSVTARALAGCHPDGYPCCVFPGDPVGSCPRDDLRCPVITGCGDHRPNFTGDEPIISSVREPSSRLLSGFFYYPPHRPELEKGHAWKVFKDDYIRNPIYRNVMTKMYSGSYAYDPYDEAQHTLDRAKKNVCSRLVWYGITEFPILSALLLYEMSPFSLLIPNPVAFGLPPRESPPPTTTTDTDSSDSVHNTSDTDGLRVNDSDEYMKFKTKTFSRRDGNEFVQKYNNEDYELYTFMVQLFCIRIRDIKGLQEEAYDVAMNEIHECRQVLLRADTERQQQDNNNNPISVNDLCGKLQK
jgi:hypothetical protein